MIIVITPEQKKATNTIFFPEDDAFVAFSLKYPTNCLVGFIVLLHILVNPHFPYDTYEFVHAGIQSLPVKKYLLYFLDQVASYNPLRKRCPLLPQSFFKVKFFCQIKFVSSEIKTVW